MEILSTLLMMFAYGVCSMENRLFGSTFFFFKFYVNTPDFLLTSCRMSIDDVVEGCSISLQLQREFNQLCRPACCMKFNILLRSISFAIMLKISNLEKIHVSFDRQAASTMSMANWRIFNLFSRLRSQRQFSSRQFQHKKNLVMRKHKVEFYSFIMRAKQHKT